MPKALRYRLFRVGAMPAPLKAAAASPAVLFAAEGISISAHSRSVRMPSLRTGRGLVLLAGSLVVLPDRLLAGVGSAVVLDTGVGGPGTVGQELTLSPDGARLKLEVTSVYAAGAGSVELHFRQPLDPAVLAQIPVESCPVTVSDAVAVVIRNWV